MANRHRMGDVAHTSRRTASHPRVSAAPAQPQDSEPVAPAPPDPVRTLASRTNVRQDEAALLQRFGLLVKAARTRRALSQSDLGKRARMHRTHVSLIESGSREARLLTICALAAAMRMQPGDLMPPIS